MDLKNKTVRYTLAVIACLGIFSLYIGIAAVIKWKNSGGTVMMLILFAAIAATWKGITKAPKEQTKDVPQTYT